MSHDPDLTSAQTDAVRRALAAARHDAPLPDEVASRLDARLAELVTARAAGATPGATVVSSDRFRRRKRWSAVLVAAAAVTAIGVGATQLLPAQQGADMLTADKGQVADDEGAAAESAPAPAIADAPGTLAGAASVVITPVQRQALLDAGYSRLRPAQTDLSALRSELHRLDANDNALQKAVRDYAPNASGVGPWPGCAVTLPDPLPDGAMLWRARHDDEPVLLVLAGPEATAYSCVGGETRTVPLD